MKTFSTGFAAAVAKKRGAQPLWILSISAAGTTYYLSDVAVTIPSWNGGITTKAWVSSWGELSEQVTGETNEVRVADFSVTCVVDPDASPNMANLALLDLESGAATLWLWYRDLNATTDPPISFFIGRVKDFSGDAYSVRLDLEDDTYRLNGSLGIIADASAFPNIDPGDVGKMLPIVYGTVAKVPTLAVDAGPSTTLTEIIVGDLAFDVSDASHIVAGSVILIDQEQIKVGGKTGDRLTGCTRGFNSTLITTHALGAAVMKYQANYTYLLAGHPVSSIGAIWGKIGSRLINFSAIPGIVKYTGQGGSVHPTWFGYACVTIPGKVSLSDARQLVANTTGLTLTATGWGVDAGSLAVSTLVSLVDTIQVEQGSHNHPAAVTGTMTILLDAATLSSGSWVSLGNTVDGNSTTYGSSLTGAANSVVFRRNAAVSTSNQPLRIRGGITYRALAGAYQYNRFALAYPGYTGTYPLTSLTTTTAYTGWFTLLSFADITEQITIQFDNTASGSATCLIYEVFYEVEYGTAALGFSTATGVTKTPGSTVDVASSTSAQSGNPTLTVGSITKSGVVTISGDSAANTMIADAIYCDTVAPGYSGLTLNGALLSPVSQLTWLNTVALQSNCFCRVGSGSSASFMSRSGSGSSRTISAVATEGGKQLLQWARAPITQIINSIALKYNRDLSNSGGEPYGAVVAVKDAGSISRYGVQSKDTLFQCDFIGDSGTAGSMANSLLAQFSTRRTYVYVTVYLDQLGLEFGDHVTLPDGRSGMVVSVGIQPGSIDAMDRIKLTVMV